MRAACAVDELDVEEERSAVAAEADRQLLLHLVEVERVVALVVRGPSHFGTRQRRHEHLGLDAGGHHLRRLDDLGRQHALLDEEDVGLEARALVARAHLRHDTRQRHRFTPRHRTLGDDDVVELEVLVGRRARPRR